jgi:hypothetical protein
VGAARAPQDPAGAAHRVHQLLAGAGRQPERVGDLLDRVAGAVERGDDLLGSQTNGKLGGIIPGSFRMCGLWVRVGLVPALRTLGRRSDGTCGKPGPDLALGDERHCYGGRCRCRPALWGRPLRRSRPEGSGPRVPPEHIGWVTRRGRGRVGAAPLLSLAEPSFLTSASGTAAATAHGA